MIFSKSFWYTCFISITLIPILLFGFYYQDSVFSDIQRIVTSSKAYVYNKVVDDTTLHTITLTEDGFEPKEITIKLHDTVIFNTTRNIPFWPASNLHPQHTIYPEFDPLKPIAPEADWSFKFDKVGSWKFHDHISANYIGSVIVLDENGTLMVSNPVTLDINECSKITEPSAKRQCWDSQLSKAMEIGGVEGAFSYFSKLYKTEPDVPKECHGWSHTLGKAGYEFYKLHGTIDLKPETAYCGYGFFHAFLAELMKDTGDLSQAKKFCEYAESTILVGSIKDSCIHGIGHGAASMLVENPENSGDFMGTSDKAIAICEKIYTDKNDLLNCYDGIYNEIYQDILNNRYGYSYEDFLKPQDPFWQCQMLNEAYRDSCYVNVVGIFSAIYNNDFIAAMKYAMANVDDIHERGPRIVAKIAADRIQTTIVSDDHSDSLKICELVPIFLYDTCFRGILNGFIQHGEPGNLHQKGFAFCDTIPKNNPWFETCNDTFIEMLQSTYTKSEMTIACEYILNVQVSTSCKKYLKT